MVTSTDIIGSKITGEACLAAALNPNLATVSKDCESESTGWKEPSFKVTFIDSTGKPARGPFIIAALNPFSTAGINSLGILPPLTSLINTKPC